MPADLNPHLETLFCEAIEIDDAAEREVFLKRACGTDDELRAQVVRLVADHFRAGGFLHLRPKDIGETLAQQELPNLEKAGSRIGHYKLLEQIGEGGMGSVFMAEQDKPVQRQVALKIIKAGMDTSQVIARFDAERQALAIMDHPNIAKVFEAGSTNSGRPYFVMELVKGIPITKYCDEKKLDLKTRLELMIPVCQAIQHAHQKGIIHRDIKPSNVLVARYDGRPVPKVIDFGISKATAQKLTEKTMFTGHGQIVGTIEYMSPEQAEPNQLDIDTRSDVYSLGVLLYELLTGTTPPDGIKLRAAAFGEMLRMIREEEPPRPSNRLSTVDTLANIYRDARKLDQAISLYEKVFDLGKRKLGENHPHMLLITASLGSAYWEAHDPAKALPLLKKTLELQTAKLGRDHPNTLHTMIALADAYVFNDVSSDINMALPLYQEAFELGKAKQGKDHPDSLDRMDNLAHALRSAQKMDESLEVFKELFSLLSDKLGAEHPDTQANKFQLALAYRGTGKLDQAVLLFQEIYQSRKSEFGLTHNATLGILQNLADTLSTAKEFDKAESLYRELLESQTTIGPERIETQLAKLALGNNLFRQGNFDAAEPLLLEGYQGLNASQATGHERRLAVAIRRLVEFYTAWKKTDEAAKWQKLLETLSPTSSTGDH